ncbi:MAG: uroporphyrinogen decarboxylase [Oscillospiraceae bacterium]|nr:uroporphyrinogen decarboxylase [Oscillospiraceae bacterium]
MLTKRQNLMETIRGGNPDRFVNQYEPFAISFATPYTVKYPQPQYGGEPTVDGWGVTKSWPEGTPGAFPVHDAEHIVCKDIENWRDYVKAPSLDFTDEDWAPFVEEFNKIDRNEYLATVFYAPGIFEQCHYLMEITNCLEAFYTEPEALKEMIDYIADWELEYAKQVCHYLKPDCLFHHDDWGSQISTFISPAMFEEFFLDAYKKVYGYYKEHGVEVIMHHSDSYAATLVPYMVEMGIDIWQGVMRSNDIAALQEKYAGQITFMGGIDSAEVDFPGWTREIVAAKVRQACEEFGKNKTYWIPSASQGLPLSNYPGVYEALCEEIDNMSKEMF